MDSRSIIYLVAAFFGAAPLVFGIGVRGAVRRSRQEYVDSLREFFQTTPAASVKAEIGAEQRDTVEFGCAPHAYVMQRRIAHAKRELSEARVPLATVAENAGFFTRAT